MFQKIEEGIGILILFLLLAGVIAVALEVLFGNWSAKEPIQIAGGIMFLLLIGIFIAGAIAHIGDDSPLGGR